LFELHHVTGEDLGIHAELDRPEQEIVSGQLAPKKRHHLTERISPALRLTLRPEERDDRVTAQPSAPVDGEHGEQGERTAVRRRAAYRGGVLNR
jgi:hypothetical protein